MPGLWLIGMMGSWKSTVGPLAAARLGMPYVDLDERVAASAGAAVADLFASEGEEGFRRREGEALAALAGQGVVAACGGIVPMISGRGL